MKKLFMCIQTLLKKKDYIWVAALAAIIALLIIPFTHRVFIETTNAHPYLMGFIKVAILATMGELLALRIVAGDWKKPAGIGWRMLVWGFLGMTFVIVFALFSKGVAGAMSKGLLPNFAYSKSLAGFMAAFFTSAFMNLLFAPTFMAFHRVTDTFIDLGEGKLSKIVTVKLETVVKKIDWNGFIGFVVIQTIPFFWIPAHTITFLLPEVYRVLMAAFLSLALGAILAFSKKKTAKTA